MAKQYKIKISPEGEIEVETIGFKGKECLKHIDILEELWDAEVIDSDFLDDYFMTENSEVEEITDIKETENLYVRND